MASHVVRALGRMGHEVHNFADRRQGRTLSRPAKALALLRQAVRPGSDPRLRRRLLAVGAEVRPELVLAISVQALDPQTIGFLQQEYGARVVAWFPDHLGHLGPQDLIKGGYDCVFTKCRDIEQRLRACGRRSHYLPEACAPEYHAHREPRPEYACEIVTAASYYPYRVRLLEVLADRDLRLWGSWPRLASSKSPLYRFYQGRDVYLEEKALAFSSARLVVNTLFPSEANSTNVRLFEAACSGTLVLTEYRSAVDELYDVGREIDVFQTRDELREKALYYLDHPESAREMGSRAAERSTREHTYEARLEELLRVTWTG